MAKVSLLTYTPEPEKFVAAAAKLCYSPAEIESLMQNLTPENTKRFLQLLTELGHASPIEHVSFSFGIEEVSRTLLAQITRHRIASYSVQSQRYVKEANFSYVTPPEIAQCPQAAAIFQESMQAAQKSYLALVELLEKKHLATLLAQGKAEKQAATSAEKMAIEDARFVLPNACDTKMIVTMNARSLQNFFTLRCCGRAQWEIRELAEQMLLLVRQVAPTLFRFSGPPCLFADCPEGKMSCGKQAEMRKQYQNF